MKHQSALRSSVSAAILAAGLSTMVMAQTAPTRWRVTVTRVKPEMLNEWIDLQKTRSFPL